MDLFSVMLGKKLGGGGSAPVSNNNSNTVFAGKTSIQLNQIIEKLTIPEGYKSTSASSTFQYMLNLKEISIPSTFPSIGSQAFVGCDALEKIIVNKPEGSISGAPWGAPASCEVIWKG